MGVPPVVDEVVVPLAELVPEQPWRPSPQARTERTEVSIGRREVSLLRDVSRSRPAVLTVGIQPVTAELFAQVGGAFPWTMAQHKACQSGKSR